MKPSIALSLVVLSASALLGACTPGAIITGGVAATGAAAAGEGGIQGAYSDATIQAQINDLWFQYNVDAFRKLDMTINQGRVLLTGVVQDPEHRVEAVRLAWQPKGVKQVINEIQVAESEGFMGFARDTWITSRLRAAITLDRDVQSINYNIDTVQGVIYLMGVAQSQAELNRVIETARTIPDVKRVVSYVKMAGEKIEGENTASGQVRYQPQWAKQDEQQILADSPSNSPYEPAPYDTAPAAGGASATGQPLNIMQLDPAAPQPVEDAPY